jgi:pimeloyl-ACP methyl ester carboxylesterase
MAQARPDLYAAFVGTGMAVCSQDERQSWQYAYLQARAKAVGDAKGLAELKLAGPPPWPDESDNMKHMVQAAGPYLPPALSYDDNVRAVLTAPHWSLSDVMALQRGIGGIRQTVLWREVLDMDFAHFGETFAMPVVIVQGELDLTTPTEFARAWLGRAKAPAKALAVIQGQGHEVLSYDNAAFAEALYAHLTPLLSSNPAS